MEGVEDAGAWLRFYLDAFGAIGRSRPRVAFVSAREDVIADVARRLAAIGIAATVRLDGPAGQRHTQGVPGARSHGHGPWFRVEVGSRSAVLRLLDAAMPSVPAKREAAEALVRRLRDPGRRWPPEPEELRRAYWGEGLSLREVGERFGYTESGISRLMKRYGIPTRAADGGRSGAGTASRPG